MASGDPNVVPPVDGLQQGLHNAGAVSPDVLSIGSDSDLTLIQSNPDDGASGKAVGPGHTENWVASPPQSSPHGAQPPSPFVPTHQVVVPPPTPPPANNADLASNSASNEDENQPEAHGGAEHRSNVLHRLSTTASVALSGSLESTSSDGTFVSNFSYLKRSADGTLSLVLPKNPAWLVVFGLHYVALIAYNITILFFQATSGDPNAAEKHMDRMQNFFGNLAHDDAAKIVEAIKGKTNEDEKKWDAIHAVIKACMPSSHKNATDTECNKALSKFDLQAYSKGLPVHAHSRRLAERKLAEISTTLQEEFDSNDSSGYFLGLPLEFFGQMVLGIMLCILLSVGFYFFYRKPRTRWYSWPWSKPSPIQSEKVEHEKPFIKSLEAERAIVSGSDANTQQHFRRRVAASNVERDIWSAVLQQDLERISVMRAGDRNFDFNQIHRRYGSVLSAAARCGHTNLVVQLLEWGADPSVEGGEYHNPVQSAAHSGSFPTLSALLNAGAKDETLGGYYGTAINAAAEKGDLEMIKALLNITSDTKTRVNVPGGKHYHALTAAAARGQSEIVEALITSGSDINASDETGVTALQVACAGDHLSVAKYLIASRADTDKASSVYGTPILAACQSKANDVAMELLEAGADTRLVDDNGRTPLIVAINNGLTDLADALILHDPKNLNVRDINGSTALHYCAIKGNARITSSLLARGADPSIGDKFDAQPLFRAAGCHHADVVKILLDGGADVHAVDCFGQTALHGPAEDENVEVQRLLIKKGANVNAKGARKITPLHEACNMGRRANVELLLERKELDVNVVDDGVTTPLCRAICSTNENHFGKCIDEGIVLLMLQNCPELNVNLCNGLALQEACRKGMLSVVILMLELADTNVRLQGGKYGSALQAAAMAGSVEIMELLLDKRADVDQPGGEYGSPLAAAAAFGQLPAVEFLLEKGANPLIKSAGRYWSAYNSVGRAMNDAAMSVYQKDDIVRRIKNLIEDAAPDAAEIPTTTSAMEHLRDRWILLPTGWDWLAEGEL